MRLDAKTNKMVSAPLVCGISQDPMHTTHWVLLLLLNDLNTKQVPKQGFLSTYGIQTRNDIITPALVQFYDELTTKMGVYSARLDTMVSVIGAVVFKTPVVARVVCIGGLCVCSRLFFVLISGHEFR